MSDTPKAAARMLRLDSCPGDGDRSPDIGVGVDRGDEDGTSKRIATVEAE